MPLFFRYLKQKRNLFLLLFLFVLIFSVVFYLYRFPLEAIAYPTMLCALVGLLFLAVDFFRFRSIHIQLSSLIGKSAELLTQLPQAHTIEEADYQELLQGLYQELSDLQTSFASRYLDMTDYYTVWVHQIKTPIASMRLTLQNEDSAQARQLSSDLSRIEQYVEMVLAFLRLDSDSTDYVFRQHSLDSLIRQSIRRFSSEFISRKLALDFSPTNAQFLTDEKWFCFVLEQLLSNALKYTRSGTIHIFLSDPHTLCVEDTGIGIAPEDLPRIFEKGYTGYNGRSNQKASGLGLYLCRRICKNLGIRLSADSTVGQGTRIFLNLEQYPLIPE